MRVLHAVEFYTPAVGGMQEVVKQLSEKMVMQGHEVTVLTSKLPNRSNLKINDVNIVEFDIKGNLTKGMSGEVEKCQNYLKSHDFDIITLFAAQQWTCDIFFKDDLVSSLSAKKVFVPTGFSSLYDSNYQGYFEKMKDWLHKFDMNIFLSNDYRDINFARKANIKNYMIIPNGASSSEFHLKKNEIKKDHTKIKLLHVGNHTGQKGHKELIYLYDKCKPEPSVLWIVGKEKWKSRCYIPCKIKSFLLNLKYRLLGIPKTIRLMQISREETIKKFYEADLFVFPSNIECSPIVLFEAMAASTPFFSSVAGNAEEIISWSGAGTVMPSHKDEKGITQVDLKKSVSKLNELIADSSKREELGKAGYQAWRENFTWESITTKYLKVYEKLVEEQK